MTFSLLPSRRPPVKRAFRALRRRFRFGRDLRQPAPDQIIPGGMEAITSYFDMRESRYNNIQAVVPRGRIDFQAMKAKRLPDSDATIQRRHTQDARAKYADLCLEFPGQPELFAFHALIMALLRRRNCPPRIRKLFFRLWEEEGAFLAAQLPVRWLISSATTFAEIGATPEQRLAGNAFSVVFDLIKLHDSERRLSGQPNSVPFPLNAPDDRYPLAFDLDPYSMPDGDLEITLLMRLNKLAEADAVFRPLGTRLMTLLMTDNRTVFARIQAYKAPNSRRGNRGKTDNNMGRRKHV